MIKKISALFFVIISFVTTLAGADLAVIYGDKSINNAGERSFAKSLSNHAVRWFKNSGLTPVQSSDTDLAAALEGKSAAMLVYMQHPTAAQIKELKKFVKGGGRLIVTYSYSAELAAIVGVKLGKYHKISDVNRMLFTSEVPRTMPGSVTQTSSNIITAFPIKNRSRVIAWWGDSDGNVTTNAAWLKGDGGYWMTHVLLGDGESGEKEDLLLTLAGEIDSKLWKKAAGVRMKTAANVGKWKSVEDAEREVNALSVSRKLSYALGETAKAKEARRLAEKAVAAGRYSEAWMMSKEISRHLNSAYGAIQTPKKDEIRAVWDHSGLGIYPGNWNKTCKQLSEAGISDIFVNVAAPGFTHCNLSTLPHSPVYEKYGDQLEAAIKAARPYGIRVHAWMICFSTTGATANRKEIFQKNGWLLSGTDGKLQNWLDPSSVQLRTHLTRAAAEIMTKYKADGLHLDFVRYDNYYASLGYTTKVRFEKQVRKGVPVDDWKEAAKKKPLFNQVTRWRASQVTALVADIKLTQRMYAPKIILSAAVLGKYPTCVESVGQDWVSWLNCGYIDYAVPMNYTSDPKFFTTLLTDQIANKTIANKLIIGIGVTAAESRLKSDNVIDQIKTVRNKGAAGFALFDLDLTLMNEILPILKLGITNVK